MESIDLNRLKTAITYAERIADGKNPVTNAPAREEDVINNPNVIRCMFFIRDVLRQVVSAGGIGRIFLSAGSGDLRPRSADQ